MVNTIYIYIYIFVSSKNAANLLTYLRNVVWNMPVLHHGKAEDSRMISLIMKKSICIYIFGTNHFLNKCTCWDYPPLLNGHLFTLRKHLCFFHIQITERKLFSKTFHEREPIYYLFMFNCDHWWLFWDYLIINVVIQANFYSAESD